MTPQFFLIRHRIVWMFIFCIVLGCRGAGIQPWSGNPWYWSYDGAPVLLIGGSDDDNLFQWPSERLVAQLDRLVEAGGNVIRNTMSDRQDKGFELYPFRKLEDGRYDLNQWNREYWGRFEFMLKETAARGIIVQIEVWDRFDYSDNRGRDHWQRHPYHPKNNVNYTAVESGFASRYDAHPGANEQPFFFTTPEQRNNRLVLGYQEAFVNKLLDYSLAYDHVLYCIDNETKAEAAWGRYWAQLIRARAQGGGKRVYVTEMWDAWNLQSAEHRQTFDHPELYDFVDVSQNNHNSGRKHWDNFLHVKKYLATHPRPINTTKTYGADGNKFGHTDQDAVERFWRHLLAGAASARFHRPDSGLGLNDKAVNCLKAVRLVEQLVPFWDLQPTETRIKLLKGEEAYVLSSAERTIVTFLPYGTEAQIDVSGIGQTSQIVWIDIDRGEKTTEKRPIPAGDHLNLTPSRAANWVVVVLGASN